MGCVCLSKGLTGEFCDETAIISSPSVALYKITIMHFLVMVVLFISLYKIVL